MKWALALALVLPALAVTPAAGSTGEGRDVQVGSLTLRECDVAPRALCGSIRREWEPGRPEEGTVRVGFVLVQPRDTTRAPLGTLVPHEGGPGYSTTGSVGSFLRMYGPLLDRRQVLLVDQRGTGRSEPIDCPELQDLRIDYHVAAGRCGRSLGDRADDYTTALSADDTAAVAEALELGPLDLYGDSYGTFFQQVFAGRHPDLVRSVVLDGAYPTYGESAWYPTQGPAMRRSFTVVCERSRACREGGAPWRATLRRVLERVREQPWRGRSHDADGRRARVVVDPEALVSVAYGATYGPAFYREMTAAMRSALRGDRAPLLRLVAEALGGGTDAGSPRAYSEGLDAAVACHDYPQLYDMTAESRYAREAGYQAALLRRSDNRPRTYGPFTVHEYAGSDWQMLDWCLRWPVAAEDNPAGPVRPPGGAYPDVPVLVLSGELDSITTPAEGAIVAEQFPDATHVVVPNSFHVTALGDTDGCARGWVRAFVRDPERTLATCTARIAPVDALGVFPQSVADLGRRRTVAATVADVIDRWWNNWSGHGVGLRGGTFRYRGYRVVEFRLDDYRLVDDLAVSGTVVWDRYAGTVSRDLTAVPLAQNR